MSLSEFDRGWIVGFIEGEGSFTFDVQGGRQKKSEVKVLVPRFCINQTNKVPLEFLMGFFGGGHIYRRSFKGKSYWSDRKSTRWDYIVNDIATLKKVRDFCDGNLKHPLKKKQFEKWKMLFNNFLGKEGQRELARSQMNKRWSKPSYRAKMRDAMKNRWDTAERKKQSDRMIQRWADFKEKEKPLLCRER
jgi:hypothetical protein